ncbi:MAG: putative metal-binding motif-containing protein, partial [Myxococcales bacterium]|nr:putative metal-binding motif-containing protein [Myxococcales bacterium]
GSDVGAEDDDKAFNDLDELDQHAGQDSAEQDGKDALPSPDLNQGDVFNTTDTDSLSTDIESDVSSDPDQGPSPGELAGPCLAQSKCSTVSLLCVLGICRLKTEVDSDGDGHISKDFGGDDCDDNDKSIYPGAPELCDGKANNCGGKIDEGINWNGIAKGEKCQGIGECGKSKTDGSAFFGVVVCDPVTLTAICSTMPSAPAELSPIDKTRYGGTLDVCGDGLDNNCNGDVDDYCDNCNGLTCQSGDICDRGVCLNLLTGACNDGNSTVWDGCKPSNVIGPFQVNTLTAGGQSEPSVAPLVGGGYIVVWESGGQDGDGFGVYAQRFSPDGSNVGPEFRCNTQTKSDQSKPVVAGLSDGGFVVVWESLGQDGDNRGVFGQRFDADGNKIGVEFQINTYVTSSQAEPSVAALLDGGFIVTWWSQGQLGQGQGVDIFSQRYDSEGKRFGDETQVNSYTASDQYFPVVAGLASGGYAIAWTSFNHNGEFHAIVVRVFQADGTPLDIEAPVSLEFENFSVVDDEWGPAIAALTSGGFVVAWRMSYQDTGGLYFQRFEPDGTKIGTEVKLDHGIEPTAYWPSLAGLTDGGFVVSKIDSVDGFEGIYARIFDSQGSQVGDEISLEQISNTPPKVAALLGGKWIIVWGAINSDSDGGVFAQRFGPGGLKLYR